jgi:hypothetical protein
MKQRILKIDKGLNDVHAVLTRLVSKKTRTLTKKEVDEIDAAEELLNNLRTALVQIADSIK